MNNSEIILYTTPEGKIKVEVILRDETVWLTQRSMGELFGVVKSTISEHLSNIYQSGELEKEATVRKIRTVQKEAGREVSMYLDYAENQAARQIPMRMKDWVEKLDAFLQFNDYSVLKNTGSISADIAKKLASKQFEKFRVTQDKDFESDFDREIKRLKGE